MECKVHGAWCVDGIGLDDAFFALSAPSRPVATSSRADLLPRVFIAVAGRADLFPRISIFHHLVDFW